ncbi:APC family permease [Agrococcus sp. KRD186]|jgi:APA family basic amino acid/polyamine antiporter|uniref:APC family permease n=1 Tax=Agrococcus sp. KRD186 TaxID=2729730 RepID=UPI0019D08A27|nr:APC family permease [Agrococcus sp. KRD186]
MTQLERRIGVPGAIAIGLGAMIGAGLFFVWAPAAALAGSMLPAAIALAGAIAVLNALSTAQLAMEHPVSGGAYAYGRAEVGERVGFAAGWMFLTGKTASAAAIAVIAGQHLWPQHAQWVAAAAVALLAVLNMVGVRVTAWVSSGIVAVVLVVVVFALVWAATGAPTAEPEGWLAYAPLSQQHVIGSGDFGSVGGTGGVPGAGPLGWLTATGMLFFAFAGYARMATLGEEVRDPRRTLPIAIVVGLGLVLALYAAVGWATSARLGELLPISATPLADLVGDPVLHVVVLGAGALACLGSLMGLLAGLSRTGLAMARNGDLPGPLSFIAARTRTPVVAEATTALAAIAAALLLQPGSLVAFSSTCVLTYYAVAHLSAIRMRRGSRAGTRTAGAVRLWLPAWVPWVGAVACLAVVLTLPWQGVLGAAVWLGLGLAARELLRPRRPR